MAEALHLEMLALAKDLARKSGKMARAAFTNAKVSLKADQTFVTETDHAIQRLILDTLAERYPGHAVAAEEEVDEPGRHAARSDARYCWTIDPLDGTRNYVAGLPCFSTAIAVLDDGRPVVAVVYEHNVDWLFSAVEERGACWDDRPVQVSDLRAGRDRLVAMSSSKSEFTLSVLGEVAKRRGLVLRNLGSTAMHLALVASGGLDAAVCTKCKIWDIAAGALLVTEAGGRISTMDGSDPFPFTADDELFRNRPVLAGAPEMYGKMLEVTRARIDLMAP